MGGVSVSVLPIDAGQTAYSSSSLCSHLRRKGPEVVRANHGKGLEGLKHYGAHHDNCGAHRLQAV